MSFELGEVKAPQRKSEVYYHSGVALSILLTIFLFSRLLSEILILLLGIITKGTDFFDKVLENDELFSLMSTNVRNTIGILIILYLISQQIIPKDPEHGETVDNKVFWTFKLFAILLAFITAISLIVQFILNRGIDVNTSSSYDQFLGDLNIRIMFFITAVFFAPLFEELLFRRTLIPFIEGERLSSESAIVISSFVFAISHSLSDIIAGSVYFFFTHLLSTFTIGFLLGFVYVKTRNVLYPIILHALFNGFSSGVSLLEILIEDNETVFLLLNLLIFVLLLFGFVYGIYLLISNYRDYQSLVKNYTQLLGSAEFKSFRVLLLLIGSLLVFLVFPFLIIITLSNINNSFSNIGLLTFYALILLISYKYAFSQESIKTLNSANEKSPDNPLH